ncbi:MAG: 2-dehydro-3-deoxygalactonokinase [Verrucomicrobiales bacterium]|nr:2-dehydro-3-deoxygalactonokinase [Verrucomicrobiales bacterium]
MSLPRYFFSCDWGTTRFRLRLVASAGFQVLDEWVEDAGVKEIHARLGERPSAADRDRAFREFLVERLRRLRERAAVGRVPAPVVISGMASSTVGWRELSYAKAPFPLDGSALVVARLDEGDPEGSENGNAIWLVSGVRTETDIMRGEECEVLGLWQLGVGRESADGRPSVVILPGTHAKHVWICEGAIAGFRTYMTGELCDVLARHSLLRVSVAWPLEGGGSRPANRDAFDEAVQFAFQQGMEAGLFRVRTRSVLGGADPESNGWFLSGLMVGSELTALVRDPAAPLLHLAGGSQLSWAYERAIRQLGAASRLSVTSPEQVGAALVRAHALILDALQSGRLPGGRV